MSDKKAKMVFVCPSCKTEKHVTAKISKETAEHIDNDMIICLRCEHRYLATKGIDHNRTQVF